MNGPICHIIRNYQKNCCSAKGTATVATSLTIVKSATSLHICSLSAQRSFFLRPVSNPSWKVSKRKCIYALKNKLKRRNSDINRENGCGVTHWKLLEMVACGSTAPFGMPKIMVKWGFAMDHFSNEFVPFAMPFLNISNTILKCPARQCGREGWNPVQIAFFRSCNSRSGCNIPGICETLSRN